MEDVEETVALIKEKLGDELDFIELDEAWDAISKQIFFDMLIQDLKKCSSQDLKMDIYTFYCYST